jgi:O-methyltransferase
MKQNILNFQNFKIQENMNTSEQLEKTVELLLTIIENNIDGDVVEFGCHLGETSKYLMKTLLETNSAKKLFIFDSFEGLPETTEFDQNTTFGPNDLKSSEELLINNFLQN